MARAGCCCKRSCVLWIALLRRSVRASAFRRGEGTCACGQGEGGGANRAVLRPPARCPSFALGAARAGGDGRGRSAAVRALHRSRLREPRSCRGSPPAKRRSRRAAVSGAVGREPWGRARCARRGGRAARGGAAVPEPIPGGRSGRAGSARAPAERSRGRRGAGAAGPGRSAQLQRSQSGGPGSGAAAERGGAAAGAGSAAWGGRSGAARRSRARRVSGAAGGGCARICGRVFSRAARLRVGPLRARPRGSRSPGGSPPPPPGAGDRLERSRPSPAGRWAPRGAAPGERRRPLRLRAGGRAALCAPAADPSPIPARASAPSGYF